MKSQDSAFTWGVATAAYQIEGAAAGGGKGLSTWDVFCKKPGAIFEGHDGRVACDHFHRLEEDLDLLAQLGVDAYRFSISWPRVLPGGVGAPSAAGLRFYDQLVDGLLQRGITPYATLFHWDLPQALENRGGFRSPDMPGWFAEYTRLVTRHLGDRVRHWFTLNEPHAFIEGGLRHGRHAPGLQLPLTEVLTAAHHALLSHGRAVEVIRENVRASWVAMAPVLISATPETNRAEDVEAARRFTFSQAADTLRVTAFWTDPAFGLGYPEDCLRAFHGQMPRVTPGDLDQIAQPLDVFGCNLYDAAVVRADKAGIPEIVPWKVGAPRTAFNWPVTPDAHYYGPKFAFERYKKPVLITENGLSARDVVSLDGQVHDAERVDFLARHVAALLKAKADGVEIAGYFHWSLLDNFEWNHGYRERFGLIHVDFESQKRTPKDSFFAYRDLILKSR